MQKYVKELKSCKIVAEELGLSFYIVYARLKEYDMIRDFTVARNLTKHKLNCQCAICKSKRGELKGKNHHNYGKTGKLSPTWQGGKSFEPYPLGWNKTYKEQIRYRDTYKCQLCGCL